MSKYIHILIITSTLLTPVCAEEQGGRSGEVITNSLGMKLSWIPPGEFTMGSLPDERRKINDENPKRRVYITQGFYMSQTEVTRGQFEVFVADAAWQTQAEREDWSYAWKDGRFRVVAGAHYRRPGFEQTDRHPVVCISWHDASEFCRWLAYREGRRYRLPTEAEWEYACRGGTETVYQWGDRPEDGAGWCNVADLTARDEFAERVSPSVLFSWSDGYLFTAPVGQFRPNAFGLYDMHGNVLEFCSDWYDADYYRTGPATNPTGPTSGEFRVLRGASWSGYPEGVRAAKRYRDKPRIRCSNLGFRVVLD